MATARRNQVAKSKVENPVEFQTIKEFIQDRGFISVHNEVRWNTNGYPYVTFINSENEAENIYFSKAEAENYPKELDKKGEVIPYPISVKDGFFNDLSIIVYDNEDGEERIKLCGQGASTRESLLDLM